MFIFLYVIDKQNEILYNIRSLYKAVCSRIFTNLLQFAEISEHFYKYSILMCNALFVF